MGGRGGGWSDHRITRFAKQALFKGSVTIINPTLDVIFTPLMTSHFKRDCFRLQKWAYGVGTLVDEKGIVKKISFRKD